MASEIKKTAEKKDSKQVVNDVAHPGASVPSATSRPIIVGSGKIMQDPMVSESTDATDKKSQSDDKKGDSVPVSTGSTRTIQPLSDSKSSDDVTKPKPESPAETKTESASEDKSDAASSSPAKADSNAAAPEAAAQESAVVDAVLSQTANKKAVDGTPNPQEQEHLSELIAQKTYFVPIGRGARQTHWINVLATVLSVAAIGMIIFLLFELQIIQL